MNNNKIQTPPLPSTKVVSLSYLYLMRILVSQKSVSSL